MSEKSAQPEFSFSINLGDLSSSGKRFKLKAGQEECARIARRLGIVAVRELEGEIHIRATKTVIDVAGALSAQLTRECVSSLEELDEAVADSFELEFFRNEKALEAIEDEVEAEFAEVHESDSFDLGELLVQQLSLAMDPFPRKPGATSLAAEFGSDDAASPFAGLHEALEKNN